jgi:hypothetical protein
MTVANVTAPKAQPVSVEHIVRLPTARPKTFMVAAAVPKQTRPTFVTASLGSSLIDSRGYWRGAVQNGPDLPATKSTPDPFATASADTSTTGSSALAYAAESDAVEPARTMRPMGARIPRAPREASVMPARGNTTVVAKPALAAALPGDGKGVDSPWLRAAMLAPSASKYLTATRLGAVDMRPLQELLYKPSMSVVMTFSADPHLGMVTGHFDGPAVVFVATTTFTRQSTASLR